MWCSPAGTTRPAPTALPQPQSPASLRQSSPASWTLPVLSSLNPMCIPPARAARAGVKGATTTPGRAGPPLVPQPGTEHTQEAYPSGRDDEVTALRLGGRGRGGRGGLWGRGGGAGALEAVNVTVLVADGVKGAARTVRLIVDNLPCEERIPKTAGSAQERSGGTGWGRRNRNRCPGWTVDTE